MERTEDFIPVFSLSLPEEVPLLARALSRALLMQILKQLQKKQMSPGELASELVLRLNTLLYNLSLLEKASLIKVIQVKWGCKGREVKIYAPVEQGFADAPGK
ncbi:MAG: winged helix-turn-helix domain-containing protein [Methanosarcina sp.]|nr:winged helix-turn-helix domain-containing protein [Methanosarcina sp.]